ncbi:MAG: prepilin-type N-terminal cleavage/methylation domain-containing protein [Dehalococcoidia bacterium]|nr:prepilin-type N-terminal cleavage/methylation domain-containing protein [Dehalococcoidia bacterium]
MNRRSIRNQKGVSVIEAIIALAILGVIAIAFLGGLMTSLKAVSITDERSTAQSLAQSQMEYVKSLPYEEGASPSYEQTDMSSPDYPGYTSSVDVELLNPPDDSIQKITITIKHHEKNVLTLADYKVRR